MIKPNTQALIISAIGSHDLVFRECTVLEVLLDNASVHHYNGKAFASDCSMEPVAFIDVDGQVWLWSVKHLMPLRGDRAPVQRQEMVHG